MRILGLSCDYHDAAAALVVDGRLVAAAEQERFSRVKHDHSMPIDAVASCLAIAGIGAGDVDQVVFHEKPLAVASRVVAARQRRGPAALPTFVREMPTLLGGNLMARYRIEQMFRELGADDPPPSAWSEHHLSHAAAAFLPSPFETAAILTVDGIGEWSTATMGQGLHHRIDLLSEQRYPHSLGLVYSLLTAWCGFQPNDGEYKLMGLAPFGEPSYAGALADLVEVGADGSIEVDTRLVKTWGARPERMRGLVRRFDGPPRRPGEPITRRDVDLARSVQDLTEQVVVAMARHVRSVTGERRLCLGGGVALNCVANGRLQRAGVFEELWIQPAPGDAGSALGAALWWWHDHLGRPREPDGTGDSMATAALGPRFASDEIAAWLEQIGQASTVIADLADRCRFVAGRLDAGDIVGWFEGRMEFGPRALGHRSILADPRSATVQGEINRRVKGRESFRPFAPAVLWERAEEWFEISAPSPYMLTTHRVAAEHLRDVEREPDDLVERVQVVRSDIPACTHVDGSARVQTVHADRSPVFHRLISEFARVTGCPVLLNTSFNRAGEPMVCTPVEALSTARTAGLDLLVLEDHVIDLRGAGSGASRSAGAS